MNPRLSLALVCLALTSCGVFSDSASGDGCCEPGAAQSSSGPLPTVSLPTGSPAEPEPFTFAVIGDFGTGDEVQQAVADRMCSWRAENGFDLVFTTGDNVYPDGHPDRFDEAFYEPYECLTDDGVALHAVLGNHDVKTDNGRPEIED
ncbi:MAG TPA: metallophosphoesterase [Actinomycetota bacterium]|nr:metallophosphoesterase [Actinomycetota bacterium]